MIELIILYLIISAGITYGFMSFTSKSTIVCIIGSILFGWWTFPMLIGCAIYKYLKS